MKDLRQSNCVLFYVIHVYCISSHLPFQCTQSCDTGIQFRSAACENGEACLKSEQPIVQRDCNTQDCITSNNIPEANDINYNDNIYEQESYTEDAGISLTETFPPNNENIQEEKSNIFNMIENSFPQIFNKQTDITSRIFQPLLQQFNKNISKEDDGKTGVDSNDIHNMAELDASRYKWIPLFWEQVGYISRMIKYLHMFQVGFAIMKCYTRLPW